VDSTDAIVDDRIIGDFESVLAAIDTTASDELRRPTNAARRDRRCSGE
jgi:hypothetical protein